MPTTINPSDQTITQYALQSGGASNLLNNINAVATGQVLISSGVSAQPAFSDTPTVTSITFGAGTALNAYVEGTWTPSITFGGGSTGITYTTQAGYYTRIGRMVAAQFQILLSNKGSSTGTALIAGLPITAGTATNALMCSVRCDNITFPAGTSYLGAQLIVTATSANIQAYGSGVAAANLSNTNFTNNSLIEGILIYFA